MSPATLCCIRSALQTNEFLLVPRRFEVAGVRKTENGTLFLLPLSTPPPSHKIVLVEDIKMANFKQFLASQGIRVEFAGGALRCGEYVTLQKVGDSSQKGGGNIQHINLEGPLLAEYYKI